MNTIAAVMLAWSSASTGSLQGDATYYRPGLMQEVAANRGVDLTGYIGGVALNRKGDLGREVWIDFGVKTEGPFLVVDCAKFDHYATRERQGRVVEVDARTARRHGFYGVGPVPVTVWFEDAVTCTRERCPI